VVVALTIEQNIFAPLPLVVTAAFAVVVLVLGIKSLIPQSNNLPLPVGYST